MPAGGHGPAQPGRPKSLAASTASAGGVPSADAAEVGRQPGHHPVDEALGVDVADHQRQLDGAGRHPRPQQRRRHVVGPARVPRRAPHPPRRWPSSTAPAAAAAAVVVDAAAPSALADPASHAAVAARGGHRGRRLVGLRACAASARRPSRRTRPSPASTADHARPAPAIADAALDAAVGLTHRVSRHGARVLQTVPTSDERAGRPALPPGLRCDPTSQPWRRCAPCWGRTPPAPGRAWSRSGSTRRPAWWPAPSSAPSRRPWRSTPACSCSSRAAIGLRGNIFGAFGNRLSTAIHAGTFRWSLRREAVLGQNVLAAMLLTMGISLALAVVAKAVAVGLGLDRVDRPADHGHRVDRRRRARVDRRARRLARADGRRGPLRLGPRQRDRAARVDARRRAHPAGPVPGHLPARDLGRQLASWASCSWRRRWRSWSPGGGRRPRACAASSASRCRCCSSAGCISAGAGVTLEKSFARLRRPAGPARARPRPPVELGALGGILSGRLASKLFLGLVPPDGLARTARPAATSRCRASSPCRCT